MQVGIKEKHPRVEVLFDMIRPRDILPWGLRGSQMDFSSHPLNKQYSNSSLPKVNNSNSTVSMAEVFAQLSDVIPREDPYMPLYISRYKQLGPKRFIELANKARAGATRKPASYLFFWMIRNNSLVR